MPQRQRTKPAPRLRGLSGIIDDEGIKHGQPAKQRVRPAIPRQGCGLARQPFQRAMRTDMDDRIDLGTMPEPEIEGGVVMARHMTQVVVIGLAHGGLAPLRLQGQKQVAGPEGLELRFGNHLAVGFFKVPAQPFRKRGQCRFTVRQGPAKPVALEVAQDVFGCHLPAKLPGNGRRRGQCVKPDRMGHPPLLAGIGGQDQRHAAFGRCQFLQTPPVHHPGNDGIDPFRIRAVTLKPKLQRGVGVRHVLEGDDTGLDAPVQFRQRHMHRKIGGGKAAF